MVRTGTVVTGSRIMLLLVAIQSFAPEANAEPPMASYIFPAGGQRWTQVSARVGGCNLYEAPRLYWSGAGITAPATISPMETIWFEGPLIPQPPSQQREDYPRDYAAQLVVVKDASPGLHAWRVATSQGVTAALGFVVGDFPEVIEDEVEGNVPPVSVTLPVTINGRIFPREDVDVWRFSATAGEVVTCHVATSVFGSPLDARMVLTDATGQMLAESIPAGDVTAPLRFTVPQTGQYQVQIHDVGFQGLQNHTYRLTITAGPVLDFVYPLGGRRGTATKLQLSGSNLAQAEVVETLPFTGNETTFRLPDPATSFGEVRLELDDFDEFLEEGSQKGAGLTFNIPGVLNGRIESPGDEDVWTFRAKKGEEYDFDVHAARCGSPLDSVISVCDSTGKILQEVDDGPGLQSDSRLKWTAAEDGEYQLRIRDRLNSRGDLRFAYRIRVTSAARPDFSLKLAVDSINIDQGQSVNVKVLIERGPGFKEPVELALDGLPEGITLTSSNTIPGNQQEHNLTFKADKSAKPMTVPVRVTGAAKVMDQQLFRTATTLATPTGPDAVPVADAASALWVSVAIPTPFKFVGVFESKYIPRGGALVRRYRIERNGFEGPLEVKLADRQGRHLQGVTAQHVLVEPGQNEFDFAVELPSWMEIGRTCRSTLLISGQTKDDGGESHTISYSSNDQHNQMIALVATGQLAIQLSKTTLVVRPSHRAELPIKLQRTPEVSGSVKVELIATKPIRGVSAESVTIDKGQSEGAIIVNFGSVVQGVGVHPVIIRATTQDHQGLRVTAEAKLTLVQP
jgi:hypothetical protein